MVQGGQFLSANQAEIGVLNLIAPSFMSPVRIMDAPKLFMDRQRPVLIVVSVSHLSC